MSQNTMSNVPKTIAVHQQKPEDVTFNIDRSRLSLEQCKRLESLFSDYRHVFAMNPTSYRCSGRSATYTG